MTALALQAASGPGVWRNADYAGRSDWIEQFSSEELGELETAAQSVRQHGLILEEATRDDFLLPLLSSRLAKARRELAHGRGFVMLRSIPVTRYSEEELGTLFWGLGTHLGIGVSQSLKGDRLGHVMDIGGDIDRYYTRGGELEFHMDPVDVVGLLCLRTAVSGGESRIVSSLAVYNAILAERPGMMTPLLEGFHYSRRQQDPDGVQRFTAHRVPVFMQGGSGEECYFLPASIRGAQREGAPVSAEGRAAMDYMAEVAGRPELYLDMTFREGDIQFLNNRKILHARTDYVEHPDPAKKRHLLRLWLMMPDWPPRPVSMRPADGFDRAGGGIAKRA